MEKRVPGMKSKRKGDFPLALIKYKGITFNRNPLKGGNPIKEKRPITRNKTETPSPFILFNPERLTTRRS